MTRIFKSVSAAVLFGALFAVPAMAQTPPASGAMKLSQAQCAAIWSKIGKGAKSGSVSETVAQPYLTDFKAVDTNKDGKLSQAEFNAACDKGLVRDTATTGTGAGTTGSDLPAKK